MRRSSFIFNFLPVLSIALIIEGCAVFNTIGDGISSGYENTLTYFNVYYNARSAFDDAESSIKAAAKAAEGKTATGAPPAAIPPDASKNLDLVIDKCSNILAYHSKSSYVDDALMMTGKAFYYKAEYSKAERKFLELITQYPNSSLNLEAQLWYCRSEEKLNENDEARKNLAQLIASAEQSGKGDILAEAYSVMGLLSTHDNAVESAIEAYRKSANAADSDQLIANAWFHIGRLYFDDGQFQNSIDAFLKVEDLSDDVYQIFRSKLLATQAYRKLRLLDKALALENELAKDYRFKDYLGSVLLERGTILLTGGRQEEALDIFRALDTTYARTETGANADFELGKYFERTGNDYAKARDYYTRAMTATGTAITEQSAHKVIALNLYFKDLKDLSDADSILTLVMRTDSARSTADSLGTSRKDTSAVVQDSVKSAQAVVRNRLSVDSLNAIEARAAAGLGELFYTDLANPDSAIYWLRYSLLHQYVEHSAPRILYMLSELATSYPDRTTVTSKEFQDQLVRDFPNSYFARELQHLPAETNVAAQSADSALEAYNAAEGLIDAGKNEEALAALDEIITRYPASPVIPKCRYAIGWLYENRLAKMDSAAAEYKLLIAQYPATPYARAVSARQLDTLATTAVKIDTVSRPILPQAQKKDSVEVGETGGLNVKQMPNKPPGYLSRRARILQSQHPKKNERE
jgi:tetratricopeptide (TPR) repeat protein